MNRSEVSEIYNAKWCQEFKTMDKLYKQIKTLAKNGAYQMCLGVDSSIQYETVKGELIKNGYDVEDYNNSRDIMEIAWG